MSLAEQSTITITPQSPTIGAVVSGIDLREAVPDAVVSELRDALLRWKVLFFRDQDITAEQHLAFGRKFGELEVHPFSPQHAEHPEILCITHDEDSPGYENVWHSDVTWRLAPSLGSILKVSEVPPVGGDTLFADMGAAYDGLPEAVKEKVDGAVARHDFDGFRRGMKARGASEEELAEFDRRFPNPMHPVVRTHPETGRRSIYVNAAFAREIVGWDPDESRSMLELLQRQANTPEYQCRFSWEPNSIAFWDNRACQHYASSDYFPHRRVAERVTVIGDVPYFDADQPVTITEESPVRGAVLRRASGRD